MLFDVGLGRPRGDPAVVFDLDAPALLERFSVVEGAVAPKHHDVIQAHMGLARNKAPTRGRAGSRPSSMRATRAGETGRHGVAAWSSRGAPGRWIPRSEPARPAEADRGEGIFVAGDLMAAPGVLSEVALSSAVEATTAALRWNADRPNAPPPSASPAMRLQ